MENLDVLTIVWGRKHVDLFKETTLRSLTWPQNLQFLRDIKARWNIFTDNEFINEIKELMPEGVFFNIQSTEKLRDFCDQTQSAMFWQIGECLDKKRRLLLAAPDTLFGEGTLEFLYKVTQDPDTVAVFPHVRCNPSLLKELGVYAYANKWLVTKAFNHLHESWTGAEKGHLTQTSFVGGVEWEMLSKELISVIHRLPSPYMINFTEEDLTYFKSANSFGNFDHRWPGDILIPRARQRFIGSSDAAFAIEITDPLKNIPPLDLNGPRRGFWQDWPHNRVNSQINSIFRKGV